jgi:radical SAM superfamily enzyme YgiQ (UPF0313 family)
MLRITFIEPRSPGIHVFTKFKIPRIGMPTMATRARELGHKVRVFVEDIGKVDFRAAADADLVCIGTITLTAPRAYAFGDRFRRGGVPVLIGGPHPTAYPGEALAHADWVLRGEADETFFDFLKKFEAREDLTEIEGLSYRTELGAVHNPLPARAPDLDDLPMPDLTLIQGWERMRILPIMTSRGCPYDCAFCSVTKMFGRRYRFRSADKIVDELERALALKKWYYTFFVDDNFIANRQRAKALMRLMIERKVTPRWTAQVRVEVAKDDEMLDLMRRSNCRFVYVGLESTNPETLKLYNKQQSLEDIEQCIRKLHANKIRIHGMFVFGADTDTPQTLRETGRFARRLGIDTVQFLILTPLPDTGTYRQLESEGRILVRDWSLYGGQHVVFKPKLMSPLQLHLETWRALGKFYSPWEITKTYLRFDFFGAVLRTYGHRINKQWLRFNTEFSRILEQTNCVELLRKLGPQPVVVEAD